MEGLLAALGIYVVVVAVFWLLILIGAISAMVAASRTGKIMERVAALEVSLARLEDFQRADARWRRAAPHRIAQDTTPGNLEPSPSSNLWEAALQERGQKECPRCHGLVQDDQPACECGYRW